MRDATSELVAGRYRPLRQVGLGGMGVVWEAVDERLDRVVALKRLTLPIGLDADEVVTVRLRTAREGRIAAQIDHPNAVAVHDVVEEDGWPVLVMEYVPWPSLAVVLEERGRLRLAEMTRIGADIAAALAAVHAAGVVHRDVKPANILAGGGAAKITDFGISHATSDPRLTRTGLLVGTPGYLSPEAARGEEPSPASDVFSLGATLQATVDGSPPYGEHSNPLAVLHAAAAGQILRPERAGSMTPLLLSMLEPEAGSRPTMAEAGVALRAFAEESGGQEARSTLSASTPVSIPTAAMAPSSATRTLPRRWFARAAAAALLLVVTAAASLPSDALGGGSAPLSAMGVAAGDGPASSPVAAESPTVGPADAQRTVALYYALLPDRSADAWLLLGPELQAQDAQAYEEFWASVASLDVVTPPTAGADPAIVTVGIEYTLHSGEQYRETRQVVVLAHDDGPLIGSDQRTSIEHLGTVAAPEPPPEPAPGGGGNGEGKDDEKDNGGHGHEDD